MAIEALLPSDVVTPGQAVAFSSLFATTAADAPAAILVEGLDRVEYVKPDDLALGTFQGSGAIGRQAADGGDAYVFAAAFTRDPATGRYVNPTYGDLGSLTFEASNDAFRNEQITLYGIDDAAAAANYARHPDLALVDAAFGGGDVTSTTTTSVVIDAAHAGAQASQATPSSIAAIAQSYVGQAWNEDGCWLLCSAISARAGASLPVTSSVGGLPDVANGEWFIAYDGATGSTGSPLALLKAGEMFAFETKDGGHITTVVSGSGSAAQVVDNIIYESASGKVANAAPGTVADVTVAAAHPASQELASALAGSVVVYELDTPSVKAAKAATATARPLALSSFLSASDPEGKAVSSYQVYDSDAQSVLTVAGAKVATAHSAATAATLTAAQLAGAALTEYGPAATDAIEARASNGEYWGDWTVIDATVAVAAPPRLAKQTAAASWAQGSAHSYALPAGTFVDPAGLALTYSAKSAAGALPAWLSFDPATLSFSGTPPYGQAAVAVTVTATDADGLSASETFTISTPSVPRAPVAATPVADVTAAAGSHVSIDLSKAFADPNGERVALAVTETSGPAAGGWLAYSPTDGTLSGAAPAGFSGDVHLEVSAVDSDGAAAGQSFTLHVGSGAATPAAAPAAIPTSAPATDGATAVTVVETEAVPAGSEPLKVTSVSAAIGGTATVVAGAVVFKPAGDLATTAGGQTDSFHFTATDAAGHQVSGTQAVTIVADVVDAGTGTSAVRDGAAIETILIHGGTHSVSLQGGGDVVALAGRTFGIANVTGFDPHGSATAAHDWLQFDSASVAGATAAQKYATLMAETTDAPAGATIAFDAADKVVLAGVHKSALAAADVHFS